MANLSTNVAHGRHECCAGNYFPSSTSDEVQTTPAGSNLSVAPRRDGRRAFFGLIASHCFLSPASARHSRPRFLSSRPPRTETARASATRATAQPGSGSSDEPSRAKSELSSLCPAVIASSSLRKDNSTSCHMIELSKLLQPATLSIWTRETCSSARYSIVAG